MQGYSNSFALDINNAGDIVGQATTNSSGVGWKYSNGGFETIVYAAANLTSATTITDWGLVAGYYEPVSSTPRFGFLQFPGGELEASFDLSPVGRSTTIFGINNGGDFVGSLYLHSGNVYVGYLLDGSGSTIILDYAGANYTSAHGINDSDQVVGTYALSYESGSGWQGFLYENGAYTSFSAPGGVNGTFAEDINNFGQIVRWRYDNNDHTNETTWILEGSPG